jgi:phosphoglycolate phosphatase-like HAD superfamily hydrolase
MLRAVVFDMDGLMFNTEDVYTLAATELLRRRGHVFTPELKDAMMGLQARPSIEVMIQYCGLTDDWHPLAVETAGLFIHFLSGTLSPMPGLMDLLDALERSGIPKAIGTSSSLQLVEPCLEPFGLKPRFQFILTAEDITRSKPDPDDGLGGQRKRLPSGGRRWRVCRGRAWRTQQKTRLRYGVARNQHPRRPTTLSGIGHRLNRNRSWQFPSP